jgi:predicted signal transduction protein with EAL and GGDEF domain
VEVETFGAGLSHRPGEAGADLATADAQGAKESACLPTDAPWLYRRWMRAAERSEVVGYRDAVRAGPAPDAVAQLATDGTESGELRLAFATAVASVGLDEREQADLATFAAAIPAAVQVARRLAVERQLRAQAEHQARHDALTGLANRRQLLDDTAAALAADASCLELTLLEVTGLRELAGTVGHAAADRLLVMVADRIAAAAGERDFSELRLPADLVSQVPFSDRAAALVAGTIATATRLGLHTTARGVDSDAHAAALRDMGCSAGQGEHVALTVEGVKAGRYLWATGLLSEALHPPADVVVLARQRERRRRTT